MTVSYDVYRLLMHTQLHTGSEMFQLFYLLFLCLAAVTNKDGGER